MNSKFRVPLDIGKRKSKLLLAQKFQLGETTIRLVKVKADQGVSFNEILELVKKAEYTKFFAVDVPGFIYVYALIRFFATGKYFRVYPCQISNEDTSPYIKGEGYTQISSKKAEQIWNKIFEVGDKCFHRYQ